jgi:hypothetical protein
MSPLAAGPTPTTAGVNVTDIIRSWYEFALLLHLLAVAAAFAATGILHFAVQRMRTSDDVAAARDGAGLVRVVAPRMPVFVVLLLLTGAWLTGQRWSWATPWVVTGVAGLVAMIAISAAILKPRLARAGAALATTTEPRVQGALAAVVRDPLAGIAAVLQPSIATGILAVMALKPGPLGCALVMLLILAAGLVLGREPTRVPAN